MKVVGKLTWHDTGTVMLSSGWQKRANPYPVWGIEALPHVVMRLKRVFARIETSSKGTLCLAENIQTAREIEWVLGMFPLEMDAATRERLTNGASRYREREQAIDDILGGKAGRPELILGEPGMTPREYQLEYVNLLSAVERLLLGDATGVGKTITTGLGLALEDALPALVVVPTHLPVQWTKRLGELWPLLRTHTLKGTRPYDLQAARGNNGHYPDVLITPYSRLAGWSHALAGQVRTLILDEVQELRNGRDTERGKGAAMISEQARYVVGASATPAHNYGGEFWNIFDIISPGALGSKDEFVREWCTSAYGDRHARIKDPAAFGTYVRSQGLMLARSRADVGRELPTKPMVTVETVGSDSRRFNSALDGVSGLAMAILSPETAPTQRFVMGGELDWKLRQATGVAKAPHVAEYVRMLLESEDKVVLYGWHRDVYDIWLDMLADFKPVLYTGTESPAAKNRALEAFLTPNDQEGASRLLIISLASGAGIDGLQEVTSTVVFGELDWSPKVHSQAIDRVDRDGQTKPVLVTYCVSEDGSDPVIAEALDLKAQNIDPVMNPDEGLFTLRPDADSAGSPRSRMVELATAWLREHDPAALKKVEAAKAAKDAERQEVR